MNPYKDGHLQIIIWYCGWGLELPVVYYNHDGFWTRDAAEDNWSDHLYMILVDYSLNKKCCKLFFFFRWWCNHKTKCVCNIFSTNWVDGRNIKLSHHSKCNLTIVVLIPNLSVVLGIYVLEDIYLLPEVVNSSQI